MRVTVVTTCGGKEAKIESVRLGSPIHGSAGERAINFLSISD